MRKVLVLGLFGGAPERPEPQESNGSTIRGNNLDWACGPAVEGRENRWSAGTRPKEVL
jgi:hypothetical protein